MIAGDINRDAVNRNRLAAFFMPRQQKGGDTVAKKMTLHELQAEQEKAERELKIAKQNLRILKSDEKKLTRKERTHRLCNHGGLCFNHKSYGIRGCEYNPSCWRQTA